MIINIFSNFDPIWFNLCYNYSTIIIIFPLLIISTFWAINNNNIIIIKLLTNFITFQTNETNLNNLNPLLLIITSLFIILMLFNITGILPYIFSITSHIIFTLSLSLPTWIILILSSATYSTNNTIAHILPDNTPTWLSPFLVLIESISILVRPLTLGFRLIANISAGHIILCLLTSLSISINFNSFINIIVISIIYITFELAICIIQAYIFCLLLSLYINDHI